MFSDIILSKSKAWIESPACKVKEVLSYIRTRGFLRQPQIEAIEVYLFLKLAGENKPLWRLLTEGFFSEGIDLANLQLTEKVREAFTSSVQARSLYEFVRKQSGNSTRTPSPQENLIANNIDSIDFVQASKQIFYGVEYNDYLLSLPMGAGKTYLMAAIMYLDLYFATNEPDNKLFAHNFLVLIPNGLKTSIVPSLKTIEKFDPAWVVPEPAATALKNLIRFEVLDEPKSASKSNKTKNPNVQKIARHQPFDDLIGLIAVVNAEKVILDKLDLKKHGELFEVTEDETYDLSNELRKTIGQIPNLQIHIDEYHHVPPTMTGTDASSGLSAKDEIKLRGVVTGWAKRGTINGVLGYSGTPYISKREKIEISENISFQSEQITNTIYYFPLINAVQTFLKNPQIKFGEVGLSSKQIVKRGVEEFLKEYGNTVYPDGTIAKLAIYCGLIDRLEDEIYPFLTGEMNIDDKALLRFHIGNAKHQQPAGSAAEFKMLDDPSSKKQIVLLAQIGKEGWDCRSLTGVILSQSGDCPKNMVLQTSCRCLREVVRGGNESALVWLSNDNAKTLNEELAKKQKTSIDELNKAGKAKSADTLERFPRVEHLQLPPVNYYRLKVNYETLIDADQTPAQNKITAIKGNSFHKQAIVATRDLAAGDEVTRKVVKEIRGVAADFNRWKFDIVRGSFRPEMIDELRLFDDELKRIFESVTIEQNGRRYFDELHDVAGVNAAIRLAFHQHRDIHHSEEIVPASAELLIVEKLTAIPIPKNYLPSKEETAQVISLDESGRDIDEVESTLKEIFDRQQKELEGFGAFAEHPPAFKGVSTLVKAKDRTFHYLPYKFESGFEKEFLSRALTLDSITSKNLEIYYNGDKTLTNFRIECFTRNRNRVGLYTPDFLIIERRKKKIHRMLILETKGSGFADQKEFVARRDFVETEFLKINNDKSAYKRFDYLYLTDADSDADNLIKLNAKINTFFQD